VLLLTKRSWLGKEDHKLENDLNKELPGILNFALDGLQRLTFENENRFTRYAGADQAISHLRDLASPVGAFVREQCVVEYGAEVNTDVLYAAYKEWCAAGEFVKSPRTHFGRDLLAACPGVKKTRPRIKGHRGHVYVGIRLRVAEDEEEPELSLSLDAQGDSVVTVVTTPATASAAGHDGHNENPLSNQQRPTAQVNGGEPAQNHGAPVVDTPNIPPGRIRELGDWVLEQAAIQNETSGDVNRAEIEEGLRIILREEAASLAEAEAAFKKVMDQVFAV